MSPAETTKARALPITINLTQAILKAYLMAQRVVSL